MRNLDNEIAELRRQLADFSKFNVQLRSRLGLPFNACTYEDRDRWMAETEDALAEAQQARERAEAQWRCFHCGFETADPKEAEAHFGERDDAEEFTPTCTWWSTLTQKERAQEFQDLRQQLNEEQDECGRLNMRCEGGWCARTGERAEGGAGMSDLEKLTATEFAKVIEGWIPSEYLNEIRRRLERLEKCEAALVEERERCAKIAEEIGDACANGGIFDPKARRSTLLRVRVVAGDPDFSHLGCPECDAAIVTKNQETKTSDVASEGT